MILSDRWLRERVKEAFADDEPDIPAEQVVAEFRAYDRHPAEEEDD